MTDQWIIRVDDREYGPADLVTLREWKAEGRVIPTNSARKADADSWSTAEEIPGLFETAAPPVQTGPPDRRTKTEDLEQRTVGAATSFAGEEVAEQKTEDRPTPTRLPRTNILGESFKIYFGSFFQYLGLTLLVIGPGILAQITNALIDATPNVDADLRKLIEGAFGFCMILLYMMLWPVYIAGIQILTAQRATGYRVNFLGALNDAVKYWPRVVFLCIFVYLCFAFWTFFPAAIALGLMVGAPSLSSIFIALLVLTLQVWITGRLFVNFMFWQQFAVLDNCDVGESLRRSKELGRSGRDLPWHRRPMWRGVFIASLWFAFVMACNWTFLRDYFYMVTTTTDPQVLIEKMRKMSTIPPTTLSIALGYLQSVLRPLLGIAFVLLYFDSKLDNE